MLADDGIDGLWVEPSPNFTYLFGIELLSLERLCGVLITPSGELRAVVPLMHAEFEGLRGVELFTWTDADGPRDAAAASLKGVDRLVVSPGLAAWALFLLREASGAEIDLDDRVVPPNAGPQGLR